MKKTDFIEFYKSVVKVLCERFIKEYPEMFKFKDSPDSLYEEYLNQKALLMVLYGKESSEKLSKDKSLLDRHKICACMMVAIVKVRLLSGSIEDTDTFSLSEASRINEQLAFMSTWELFKGFVRLWKNNGQDKYELPDTYHNDSFLDTFTRSLFFANQLNSLSTPLIANVFYLLERYCETENEKKILETRLKNYSNDMLPSK